MTKSGFSLGEQAYAMQEALQPLVGLFSDINTEPETVHPLPLLSAWSRAFRDPISRLALPCEYRDRVWMGGPLTGKTVQLFGSSFGRGDWLQIARYFGVLESLSCSVAICCHAELCSLFAVNFPGIQFTSEMVECDYVIPIWALPWIQTTLPAKPYLTAEAATLPASSHYRIGICWASLDPYRSCPLTALAPLLALEDCEVWSLQVGSAAADIDSFPGLVHLWPLTNFHDTANLIQSMDCVISVDTAVLHLAGALGGRVMALMPQYIDARWGNGSCSNWYPSISFFRQSQRGDWQTPVSLIQQQIVEAIAMRHKC